MTNPWQLYDDLIDALPAEARVADAFPGSRWCAPTRAVPAWRSPIGRDAASPRPPR